MTPTPRDGRDVLRRYESVRRDPDPGATLGEPHRCRWRPSLGQIVMTMNDGNNSARPTFEIPSQVLYREVEGQMVLLNLETEQYYGLNKVGAHIVTRLTEQPFEQALSTLGDDLDVDASVLHRDVENLIEELVQAGLLKRATNVR